MRDQTANIIRLVKIKLACNLVIFKCVIYNTELPKLNDLLLKISTYD